MKKVSFWKIFKDECRCNPKGTLKAVIIITVVPVTMVAVFSYLARFFQ